MTVGVTLTVIGFMLHIWLISETYAYLRTTCGTSVRFHEMRYQMRKFFAFKRLSNVVQDRILTFYDFSFDGNFFRRQIIDEMLGTELQHSIRSETCRHMIQGNYFFQQLPDEILDSIANCMSEEVFLRNDVVCIGESARAQVKPFVCR
jgi:hypothetical protein